MKEPLVSRELPPLFPEVEDATQQAVEAICAYWMAIDAARHSPLEEAANPAN